MGDNYIGITSRVYSTAQGVLKDIDNKDIIFVDGKGGDWCLLLADILRNEIFLSVVGHVAGETVLMIIKKVYHEFKNKKAEHTKNLNDN